jgi:hypothetical protein
MPAKSSQCLEHVGVFPSVNQRLGVVFWKTWVGKPGIILHGRFWLPWGKGAVVSRGKDGKASL